VKPSDLIVLGLPWKITEKELKTYFEQFGEVDMVQIKKDIKTGQSKGFGFVKFTEYEVQMRVVTRRHNIHGRWCDVRVPLSKGEEQFNYQNSEFNRKIFVGRISEEFSIDDLRGYFKKFGEITDVFIPKPFRGFGFVTFLDPEVAQSLCGEEHVIQGVTTQVSNAVPKVDFGASGYPPHAHHPPHHHHAAPHHPPHHQPYGPPSYGNGGSYSGHSSPRYNPYGGYEGGRRGAPGAGSPAIAGRPGAYNATPMVNSTYNHGVNQSVSSNVHGYNKGSAVGACGLGYSAPMNVWPAVAMTSSHAAVNQEPGTNVMPSYNGGSPGNFAAMQQSHPYARR
jgi:RNA recognition motif-containing protein